MVYFGKRVFEIVCTELPERKEGLGADGIFLLSFFVGIGEPTGTGDR